MKTIGLLGGMSWESTVSYYKAINEGIRQSLGGLHSAKVSLYSVDFDEIEKLQHLGMWEETAEILSDAARAVQSGGADFLLICTNTMHKVAPEIEAAISIPVIHIADSTAEKLIADGVKKVGLLGTKFTMEQDFYKTRLIEKFAIDVVTPNQNQRQDVHDIIYSELCLGLIRDESRNRYLEIIQSLYARGAEAIILGCTEIALLVRQSDTDVKLYDTTELHCARAVKLATDKN